MRKLYTIIAGCALLGMAGNAYAQDNILVGKTIATLGEPKTWSKADGTTETFNVDNLPKLIAEPTNTSNVYLFPEGGWDTDANKEIGIQGFYIDLGTSTSIGTVSTTWEGAAADEYDIYITDTAPTIAILGTTPTYSATKLGQYTANTAVMPDGAKGRYLVFQPVKATNYGWGVKIRSIAATEPAEDVLTTFKVSPGIVVANQETTMNLTMLNQFGLAMDAEEVQVTVSDNATYSGGKLTINSGATATFTATAGDATLTATVYAAMAPSVPTATSIKTPIYTNTATEYNSSVEWTTAWNGGADNLGELTFANEEVAWQFGATRCVFFNNKETTGEWTNAQLNPSAKGWRNLCMDVFPAEGNDMTIKFEGVVGLAASSFLYPLEAGKWNTITLDVSTATNINNMSFTFAEGSATDILIANIYFSPAYIEGDENAPVLGEIKAVPSMTEIELTLTATEEENDEVYYSISDGTKTYAASGKPGEEVTYTITGLQPSTTYNITVTASDGLNTSDPKSIEVKTLGMPDAPAPTISEDNVAIIYSNGYGVAELPTFANWGSAGTMSTIETEGGDEVLLFGNYKGQWGGLTDFELDIENATHLYVDIFAEEAGSVDIAPVWRDANGATTPGKTITVTEEQTGEWQTVAIPVTDFGYDRYGYFVIQIALTESTLSSFAIDNLYFAGETALEVEAVEATDELVNVYNMQGICVMRGVNAADAITGLPAGLYIVGGKKVMKK